MNFHANNSNFPRRLINRQSGVSLIEAVIALFIFSIGAMGLAAMQLTSLVSSGDSQQRSMVIWKAQDFADRIRANKGAIEEYITVVNNNELDGIGVDSTTGVIQCGVTTGYKKPSKVCADVAGTDGASCTTDSESVAYDVWDVFCNPNGGLATVAADSAIAAAGSGGVANLEVMLRKNDNSATGSDPNGDVMLVLEWLSREAEANANIASSEKIDADICDIENLKIASSLNIYCLRFSL